MAQTKRAEAYYVKNLNALLNTNPNKPNLNPLERELVCRLLSWTNGGKGKYNYQTSKEWARMLGVSNKTVLRAFARLRALKLIRWHSFPRGVGSIHLRYANPEDITRWASAKQINEPGPLELEATKEHTPIEKLIKEVCNRPQALGFDVWSECCLYCGVPINQPAEAEPIEAAQIVRAEAALPFASAAFSEAWAEWRDYRKKAGKAFVSLQQEQRAAAQLGQDSSNEAEAILAIHSAISGGFFELRPDLAARKEQAHTMPTRPVNLWDWVQAKFIERKYQPQTLEECKEWAREFYQLYPEAPAFVAWDKFKREYKNPSDWGISQDPPETAGRLWAEVLSGYEITRQEMQDPGGQKQYTGKAAEMRTKWGEAGREYYAAEQKKRDSFAQQMELEAKMRDEFWAEAERRGYDQEKSEWDPANMELLDKLREEMPESLVDAERITERQREREQEAERQKAKEAREGALAAFGWSLEKLGTEENLRAQEAAKRAHPELFR